MKKNRQSGQTIIEVVVAITIVALIIIALVAVVTASMSNSIFSKNKSLANKYVSQGIEAVRSIRDRSWNDFYSLNSGTNYYLRYTSSYWELTTSVITPAPGFNRVITLTKDTDSVTVTVNVSWIQGAKTYKSSSVTNFTKWKP